MQDSRQELMKLRNVGPAIADDLLRLGIRRRQDLAGRSAADLYRAICELDGTRHDICVQDIFSAAIAQANGEPARPWWEYSRERKRRGAT